MLDSNASLVLTNVPADEETKLAELTPALYRELRRIASTHLRAERRNHTLQPTALVHEAYLKLAKGRTPCFADEMHLLAVASKVMRQVLVDYARSRGAEKSQRQNPLDDTTTGHIKGEPELLKLLLLDDALRALAGEDEQLVRIPEMRYFGGMTAQESAEALGISAHVLRHRLRFAHAWLQRRLHAKNSFPSRFEKQKEKLQ